jgi:hypothetical protein
MSAEGSGAALFGASAESREVGPWLEILGCLIVRKRALAHVGGCYTNYGIGACLIAGISVEYGDAEHAFLDFTGLPTQRVLYNIG